MRSESNAATTPCQQADAKAGTQEWASPAQIGRIFGFSRSWYRRSVRQRLRDANVKTIQIGKGPRGLRWNLAGVEAFFGQAGASK